MKYQKVIFNQDCNNIICNIKSYPCVGPDTPLGFQEVYASRTGRVYPQEIARILISVRGWVDSRTLVRPEGLIQWKFPVTPSVFVTATARFVAQCLNQRRVLFIICVLKKSIFYGTRLNIIWRPTYVNCLHDLKVRTPNVSTHVIYSWGSPAICSFTGRSKVFSLLM